MKKRILISLSSALVLVALAVFVIAQTSGNGLLTANKSSACGDAEVVMAASSGSCCSSSSTAVMTAETKSGDCTSVVEAAVAAGFSGVIQAATDAGCTGMTRVKSAACGSEKSTEQVKTVMVSNEAEASCCEGSATAALLIDECCGSCI